MRGHCDTCRQVYKADLATVREVSRIVLEESDIPAALQKVLTFLRQSMELKRCMITIFNRQTGKIHIKEASGIAVRNAAQGIYAPGEGIIGRVVDSGTAMIVPDINADDRFLNRTGYTTETEGKTAFIAVPVKAGSETLGALSVYLTDPREEDLKQRRRLLSVVGSLIYHAVRHSRDLEEELQRLREENVRLHERLGDRPSGGLLIGTSHVMTRLYGFVEKVSASDATVLILGESGTGKSLVAQQIHNNSPRKDKPFIKLNCAAIAESIIESELFGHERGAFTGAAERRIGRFEYAEGGTIFLDEIGDIGMGFQTKLLRILQEREYERVGGNETLRADVRVIAATNRVLEERVASGHFREDLYYRLSVIPIEVPPLRERKADIILLADSFVERYSAKNNKLIKRISTPVIDTLMAYHWPGNVRELENVIERAVILCGDEVIRIEHLPPSLQMPSASPAGDQSLNNLLSRIESMEHEMIIEAMKTTRGNLSKAANLLGLTNRQIGLRASKYGIDFKAFRSP